jgi:hypothetical protein
MATPTREIKSPNNIGKVNPAPRRDVWIPAIKAAFELGASALTKAKCAG